MYEHRCLENINKLYTSAGKCDDQLKFKAIIEALMVSTTNWFTDRSQMSRGPTMIFRNPSARNSLCIFTEVLDVKNKTAIRWVGAAK